MRFLLPLFLLAQSVFTYPPGTFTYPPGRESVSTYPHQKPVSCTEIGVPGVGAYGWVGVGYEYYFPILPVFQPSPPTDKNPTSIGAGPDFVIGNAFVVAGAIDNSTVIKPWTGAELGSHDLLVWANNCFGIGIANGAMATAQVYDSGWVTGEPRLAVTPGNYEIPGVGVPATIDFADLILWQDGTTSVVVVDQNDAAEVFNGAYAPSMINNTHYDCAYYNLWGGFAVVNITATNATGSMTVAVFFTIQDNGGYCTS